MTSHLSPATHLITGRSRNQVRSADGRPGAPSICTLSPRSHHSGARDLEWTLSSMKWKPVQNSWSIVKGYRSSPFNLNVSVTYCLLQRLSGSRVGWTIITLSFLFHNSRSIQGLTSLPRIAIKYLPTSFLPSASASSPLESTGEKVPYVRNYLPRAPAGKWCLPAFCVGDFPLPKG